MPNTNTILITRRFIGMCSYYQRRIPNFSELAKFFIKLAKKFTKFEWTKKCQIAFELFRGLLTTTSVLAYPDISKPYIYLMVPVVIYITTGTISDWGAPLNNSNRVVTRPSTSYFSYYLDSWFRIKFNIF